MMESDKCVNVSRDLYLLASAKLKRVSDVPPDLLTAAIGSMGPAGFLDDLTVNQVTGFIQVMDWIIDHEQFERGRAQGTTNERLKIVNNREKGPK